MRAVRDRAVAALRARRRRGPGRRPLRRRLRSDVHRRPNAHGTSSPAPTRRCSGTSTISLWCDTLVLVYPTWWSGQPAMLKGWMDRVWVNGVAWDLPTGPTGCDPRLTNVRRLVAVTTHGSSKLVNAVEGEAGKRTLTRSLRSMCHPLARTTWIAMYGVDTSCPEQTGAIPAIVSIAGSPGSRRTLTPSCRRRSTSGDGDVTNVRCTRRTRTCEHCRPASAGRSHEETPPCPSDIDPQTAASARTARARWSGSAAPASAIAGS